MKRTMENYYKEFIIAILVIVIIVLSIFLFNKKEDNTDSSSLNEITYSETKEEVQEENTKIKVDIKGAISKPGVYELEQNSIVNDVIKLAGGLLKNADTSNINLSKEIENEMIIKVFTTTELKKIAKDKETTSEETCSENTIIIDKCTESSIIKDTNTPNAADVTTNTSTSNSQNTSTQSKIISINKASKEELTSLPGIGESKADSIIKYRQDNGSFKSKEDIKNVSGIGESIYNKIKDFITV